MWAGTQSTLAPKRPKMEGRKLGRCFSQEADLVKFLFEDEVGVRPLDEVTDPAVLDEIAPIRSFVESSLKELSCEELDVVFWEDKSGVLKMTLRGPGQFGEIFDWRPCSDSSYSTLRADGRRPPLSGVAEGL
jgi:hypothetical protein